MGLLHHLSYNALEIEQQQKEIQELKEQLNLDKESLDAAMEKQIKKTIERTIPLDDIHKKVLAPRDQLKV